MRIIFLRTSSPTSRGPLAPRRLVHLEVHVIAKTKQQEVALVWLPCGLLPYTFVFFFAFSFLEHKRRLTTSLVPSMRETRRFHNQDSNRQPLRSVWVPLYYHPIVKGHLKPYPLHIQNKNGSTPHNRWI